MANTRTEAFIRLATYGTLAPGRVNHHQLAELSGHWKQGRVKGRLVEGGWGASLGYPGLELSEEGQSIEVMVFESAELPDHWERLDTFEGDGYERVETLVEADEGTLAAFVYVLSSCDDKAQTASSQNSGAAAFPLRTVDKIRYGDTDRQGHVNNAVFATFLETGRVEFLMLNDLLEEGAAFVIARMELDFVAEVNWPGEVEIGTAVTSIGRSSFRLFQEVFQKGQTVARAETVIVQMNETTRKSLPLSDAAKHQLETLVRSASSS